MASRSTSALDAAAANVPLAMRLRTAREDRGLTHDQLSDLLGIGRATIVRWEKGTLAPTETMVLDIAEVLGVDVAPWETNARSIPALRSMSLDDTSEEVLARLRSGGTSKFVYEGQERQIELPSYVINGPPDQRGFYDDLTAMQESERASIPWAAYRRRLSLVATADGEPTAQSLLERPRAAAMSWTSNYGSHGWHRYVGRFPPHLVRALLNSFAADSDTVICDPFAGSGTTLVECRLLGIPAIGIEISPLSALISRTKACFPTDVAGLRQVVERLDRFYAENAPAGAVPKSLSHADVLDRRGNSIPSFPNIERWFTPEALLGTSIVAEFASSLEGYERDLVLTALSAKMRSIGNVDVDVVRAEYRRQPRENVDVRKLVGRHLQKMIGSIEASLATHGDLMSESAPVTVEVQSMLDARIEPGSIGHIVTSPPYGVESLSYFRTHLLSFRVLQSFLDQDPYSVGGGVIGSEYLDRGSESTGFPLAEKSKTYCRFFEGLEAPVTASDRRRTTMMMKFFDDMARVGARFGEWLAPGGCAAFVIGNKRIGDNLLPTAEIVIELFEESGLVLERRLRHKLKTNNSNSVVPWQERIINEEYVLVFRNAR